MVTGLQHAFKEWAVICELLAQGTQSIILRKSGIAEDFVVAETRFWLYPTYVHQQNDGIQEEARPALEQALAAKPPDGKVRLQLWADVTGVYHVRDEVPALLLGHLHYWSEETVRKRFHYRSPGLFVLVVRVHRLAAPVEIDALPEYDGCHSWVQLATPIATESTAPVLDDASHHRIEKQLDLLLSPTAFV